MTKFKDRDISRLKGRVGARVKNARKGAQRVIEDTVLAIHADAVSNAPVDKGDLKKDIRFMFGNLSGQVISGSEEVPYALHVEFGTSPHIIEPRNASLLRFKNSSGDFVFARRVHHPGTQAQPYMGPAAEGQRKRFRTRMKSI